MMSWLVPPTSQSLPPSPKRTSWPSSTTGCGVVASNEVAETKLSRKSIPGADHDLLERVVRVVVAEQAGRVVVAERVAGGVVGRERGEDAERIAAVVVVERERLGARHRVVAAAAVEEVVAEAAVDDVVAAGEERLLDGGVVELTRDVDGDDDVVGVLVAGAEDQLRRGREAERAARRWRCGRSRAGRRRRGRRRRRCRRRSSRCRSCRRAGRPGRRRRSCRRPSRRRRRRCRPRRGGCRRRRCSPDAPS